MIQLPERVSLVTGGSRGIGRAIVRRLARAGSDVLIGYLNSPRDARELAEEVSALGRRAVAVKADMSEAEDVESLVEVARSEFGRLDVLVANAAGGGFRPLLDSTLGNFDYAMRVNVQSLMILAQKAFPLLRESTRRGRIITLSSMGGTRAMPMYGLIGAAKGAVESMTRHLAFELGPRGVNVNCICAGIVDTGALAALPNKDEILAMRRARSLAGDTDLLPEDVADLALFLASPMAEKIQGQTIVIDGGTSIHA